MGTAFSAKQASAIPVQPLWNALRAQPPKKGGAFDSPLISGAGRVSMALERLRGGQERILDIALACGFQSISSFQRSFRAQSGITPGEYRRGVEPKRSGAGGNEESPRGESNG